VREKLTLQLLSTNWPTEIKLEASPGNTNTLLKEELISPTAWIGTVLPSAI
jgi:hypothetical protein